MHFILFLDTIQMIEKHTRQKHCIANHLKEYKTLDDIHTNFVEGTNSALKYKCFFRIHGSCIIDVLCQFFF